MFFKKKIAVIGCTGSIGKTTLDIVKLYPNFFKVELLICDKSYEDLIKQIKIFSPKYVFINNLIAKVKFRKFFSNNKINLIDDLDSFVKKKFMFDKIILGVSSIEGLKYAFKFVNHAKEILIANKESIVCGGNVLLKEANKFNCKINSIDSEHYCLSQLISNVDLSTIDSVYLTASGGPFLGKKNYQKSSINNVIKHPTWKMGKKISIDSATMVNKIFEIIEAHVLFGLPFKKIKIKIHKQSLVHACVVHTNGIVNAVMHNTSMDIPIRNSLFDNKYYNQKKNFFKSKKNIKIDFDETSLCQFKILKLLSRIIKLGHSSWILFNVINDILVKKFINNEIYFYEIEKKLINFFSKQSINVYCKKTRIKTYYDIEKVINFGNFFFKKL